MHRNYGIKYFEHKWKLQPLPIALTFLIVQGLVDGLMYYIKILNVHISETD